MKKILLIIAICACTNLFGQRAEALKKIEAARIALITERLDLTSDEAEKFWPIYNELHGKKRKIRRELHQLRKGFDPDTASEEANEKMIQMDAEMKEQQLKLNQEYESKILKVISARQFNKLRQAEHDFKELVLKKIRSRDMREPHDDRP